MNAFKTSFVLASLLVSAVVAQDVEVPTNTVQVQEDTDARFPNDGQNFMIEIGDGKFVERWVPYSEGHFETVDIGGGGVTKVWIAHDPVVRAAQLKKKADATNRNMKRKGLADILDFMSAGFADSLMEMKLADYQKQDLSQALSEYRSKLKAVENDPVKSDALKITYARKVYAILLPDQLKSIASKTDRKRRFFSVLVFSSDRKLLEISDQQSNQIMDECKIANAEIEKAIEEIESLKKECRDKMVAVYERVLTERQKKKLAERINAKAFLNQMPLEDMRADTDLKQFKH